MGVLYAKVGGTFVPIAQSGPQGPSGGPVPVGGAVGDVIIKNGTADFAVRWGYNPPKLQLTDPYTNFNTVSATPALQVGLTNTWNTALYGSGIQQRLNGLADMLRLNYFGGQVVVAGNDPAPYPTALAIGDSAHATSRRAALGLGSGWSFLQDTGGNGAKDFGIYQTTNARVPFSISPDALTINIGRNPGSIVQLGDISDARVVIGNDAAFRDIGAPHTIGLVSESDTTRGALKLGNGGTIHGVGGGPYINIISLGDLYLDGNTIYFRNAAASTQGTIAGSSLTMNANITATANLYSNQEVYCGSGHYFRVRGTGSGLYWDNVSCGFISNANQVIELYPGSILSLMGQPLRIYANRDDNNHRIQYTSETPGGSGIAMNGPQMVGYSTAALRTTAGDKWAMLESGGSFFISASGSYLKFSSRELKKNIAALDPDECLDQVRRWQPVAYDLIEDDVHCEGFIAEDHAAVTPSMVNVCGPDSERPGWANAIAYEMATPRLAGAIQALAARIEQLEGNAA